jgi:hypothetical protein
MRIAAEHLPIFERILFYGKTCFERAACPFVTQIMKVENLNLQISALPAEGRSN